MLPCIQAGRRSGVPTTLPWRCPSRPPLCPPACPRSYIDLLDCTGTLLSMARLLDFSMPGARRRGGACTRSARLHLPRPPRLPPPLALVLVAGLMKPYRHAIAPWPTSKCLCGGFPARCCVTLTLDLLAEGREHINGCSQPAAAAAPRPPQPTLPTPTPTPGFLTEDMEFPGQMWAFLSDGIGIITGSMMGTTPLTVYIESAAGIEDGGRTGVTGVCVCGGGGRLRVWEAGARRATAGPPTAR